MKITGNAKDKASKQKYCTAIRIAVVTTLCWQAMIWLYKTQHKLCCVLYSQTVQRGWGGPPTDRSARMMYQSDRRRAAGPASITDFIAFRQEHVIW